MFFNQNFNHNSHKKFLSQPERKLSSRLDVDFLIKTYSLVFHNLQVKFFIIIFDSGIGWLKRISLGVVSVSRDMRYFELALASCTIVNF